MNSLETANKKLDILAKKKDDLLLRIKDDYDFEDVTEVGSAIDDGEVALEWEECREIDYADSSLRCQQMLVDALELLEAGMEVAVVDNLCKTIQISEKKVCTLICSKTTSKTDNQCVRIDFIYDFHHC